MAAHASSLAIRNEQGDSVVNAKGKGDMEMWFVERA